MTKPHQWMNQICVVTAYSPEGQVIGTRTFTYNDKLQLVAETNVMGQLTRQYDSLGRSSSLSLTPSDMSAPSYSVSYDYAGDGRFSGLSSVIGHQSSNSWQYSYLQNSDLISQLVESNAGVTNSRSYEPNRDLITEIHNQAQGSTISKYQYENDALGRRTQRIDNTATTNLFSYNIRSELTGAIMSTNTFSYAFDQIGNRLSASNNVDEWTYLCNALNQYTNITDGVTISPTYDDDGNMTLAPLSSFGGPLLASTLGWSGENRMVSASNSAMTASYNYDYMGRRFQKTVVTNSVTNTITFIYDGWLLVGEQSVIAGGDGGNLTNVTQYVWGTDLSGTLQGAGGIGGLLSVIENGVIYYPSTDANGNITDYVDTNGTVVAHREFDPFGNTIDATGPKVNDFHFWFSSKYLDTETGLYYYGYRYYSSGMGRWMQRDPIEEMDTANLYLFVRNDPADGCDILGLWRPPWCKDECPGEGFRNNFKVTDFIMGPMSPSDKAILELSILLGQIIQTMPTGLSPKEVAEWLVQQGFPTGDLLHTYVGFILRGLPWGFYVIFEVDICKESTCCFCWEDRRYKHKTGFHRCSKGGNLGNGMWFPGTRVDQVPAKTRRDCADEAQWEVLGGGGHIY